MSVNNTNKDTTHSLSTGLANARRTNQIKSAIEWLHQPEQLGRTSLPRHYTGYANQQTHLLRPAREFKTELQVGDLVTVVNLDGATPLLLMVFNENGNVDFNAVGLEENKPFACDPKLIGFRTIGQWFKNQGGRIENGDSAFQAVRVFDQHTESGTPFTLRVRRSVTLWLLVDPAVVYSHTALAEGGLGGAMSIDIVRAHSSTPSLPDPLGDVREEFTVPAGTASAYEVGQGETIQVIDVMGQQCSDFMAINARSLQSGLERSIDSTVTRSMTRSAYPAPGLFDKFFDQDLRPLLSLRQDTVGRHDTFAYACTARGYEERGFFGHLNCSDNISNAYNPFGIEHRDAWPAINFFFNSWIDHHDNRIQSDEAWSRPGDYVALEALTDLVAVSTACPDDVDPINGWNPTDIHVRIYKKSTKIQHAVAYRRT